MPSIKQQVQQILAEAKGVAAEEAEVTAEELDAAMGVENPGQPPKANALEAGFTDLNQVGVHADLEEDIAALTDGEELSEAFKEKAATIFEAAVVSRVKAEAQKLQEAFDGKLSEAVEAEKQGLIEKVDGYLDLMVEEWMEKNELAIDRGIRTENMENFFEGLHKLFLEHNIYVPDEKFDVLEAKDATIETLSQKLDEQMAEIVALRNKVALTEAKIVAEELAKGLAETEKVKFNELVEDIDYASVEDFRKKASVIRESYFKSSTPTNIKSPVSDSPVVITEEGSKQGEYIDPVMKSLLADLDRLADK